ncbi:folate-binding protein [bacterium]|nr:folate-binding protein [bacterium]
MLSDRNLNIPFKPLSGLLSGVPTAWVRIGGPDAATFLQGQCTQDLRMLQSGDTAFVLWLSLKGKVMGESLVLKAESDAWWLWSAHTSGAALVERLDEFVIADDVTIVAGGLEWTQLTLAGDVGEAWLRLAREGRVRVWDWVRPAGLVAPIEVESAMLTEAALRIDRLAVGVPAIPAEFGPGDLPQEAGLETVAISFTKGCYLGQEVMARLQAMGQVRRRLVRVAGLGLAPAAGGELLQAGRRVGELRAAEHYGTGWLGLAMVNLLGLDRAAEICLAGGGAVSLVDYP